MPLCCSSSKNAWNILGEDEAQSWDLRFLLLNLILLPPKPLILCYSTCSTQSDGGFFPLLGEHITSNMHPLNLVIAAELVCLISASLAKRPSNIQSVPLRLLCFLQMADYYVFPLALLLDFQPVWSSELLAYTD